MRVTIIDHDDLSGMLHSLTDYDIYSNIIIAVLENALAYAVEFSPEDTGLMESSIQISYSRGNWDLFIDGRTVPYAVYNEFGTYLMPVGDAENPLPITSTSGKSAYRPFLRPAAYKALDDLNEIVNSILIDGIK